MGMNPGGRLSRQMTPERGPVLLSLLLIILLAVVIGVSVGYFSHPFLASWVARLRGRHRLPSWFILFLKHPAIYSSSILGAGILPALGIMSIEQTYDWPDYKKMSVWLAAFLLLCLLGAHLFRSTPLSLQ
jgi:hypothetical protein